VCQVLTESPPSLAEAAYINTHFAQYGIHSTGCGAVDYIGLNAGFNKGYSAMLTNEQSLGTVNSDEANPWIYLPYSGTWPATTDGFSRRAASSGRLHFLINNAGSAYWAMYTDSRPHKQRTRLSCANHVHYHVKFNQSQVIPVDYANHGFWSITLYDDTWFLFNSADGVHGERGNQEYIPQDFYISADCTGFLSPCVQAPAGPFQLLLRGYLPTADLNPGGSYELPKVQKCLGEKGIGC
jgi:hypothetical protein